MNKLGVPIPALDFDKIVHSPITWVLAAIAVIAIIAMVVMAFRQR